MSKVYQLPKIYHPDFTYPGIKPAGKVKLFRGHDVAPDLICIVPSLNNQEDLISGIAPTLTNAQLSSDIILDANTDRVLYPVAFTWPSKNDLTIMVGFSSTARGDAFGTFLYEFTGATDSIRIIDDNSDTGMFPLVFGDDLGGQKTATDSFWSDGADHTFTCAIGHHTGDWSSYRLMMDDEVMASSPTFGLEIGAVDLDMTGFYILSDATGNSAPISRIKYFYVWSRKLAEEETNRVWRDPSQFLEPETPWPYLIPSVAPPVGAIMNQFQSSNMGADLYNGTIQ
jgi:hypothetical protein